MDTDSPRSNNSSTVIIVTIIGVIGSIIVAIIAHPGFIKSVGQDPIKIPYTLIASVNNNQNIEVTLPTNSIRLDASNSNPGDSIISYQWTMEDGPGNPTIVNPTNPATQVLGLSEGKYRFNLKITGTQKKIANAKTIVNVKPIPPDIGPNIAGFYHQSPNFNVVVHITSANKIRNGKYTCTLMVNGSERGNGFFHHPITIEYIPDGEHNNFKYKMTRTRLSDDCFVVYISDLRLLPTGNLQSRNPMIVQRSAGGGCDPDLNDHFLLVKDP